MAFIELPPLRDRTVVDQSATPEKAQKSNFIFTRSWHRWLHKVTDRFQQLMPSVDSSQDIVWNDMRINTGNFTKGASADPGYGGVLASGNLKTWLFAGTGGAEELYFELQFSHEYKAGTDVYPHVHWMKTTGNAGTVIWQLEYSWANIGDVFGAPTTIAATTLSVPAGGSPSQWQQALSSFGATSGTGKKESSVILGRLFRDPAHASDTYTDDAALISFDIHFEIEKLGTGTRIPT